MASKRITVTLPEETLRLLARLTSKRNRSKFIVEAVHAYASVQDRAQLRAELKMGAKARANRDLALASEFS